MGCLRGRHLGLQNSQGGIYKVPRCVQETRRAFQRPYGHRLKMTTPREDCALIRIMRRNRFLSSSRIRVELIRWTGHRVSARTVQRRLVGAGYHSRCPARCPRLTHDHCHRHRNWNHQHWSHVIFVDELRFSLYHCDSRAWVRRSVGERRVDCCIQQSDGNIGPSLIVMGAFHASGKSELVVVDGTVNQQCYIGFLRQTLLPGASATFQRNFALVHGNATPHTARNTRNFLVGEEAEVMQWPTRNPDLNPIKHIWDQMGLFIRDIDNPTTTVVRLQEVLLQAWGTVNPEWMEVLVQSMPRRLKAVMAARGGHTRYQLEIKTQSTTMFSENFNSILTTVREIWLDYFRNVPIWYHIKINTFPLAQVSYSFNISETSTYVIPSKSAIFHLHRFPTVSTLKCSLFFISAKLHSSLFWC